MPQSFPPYSLQLHNMRNGRKSDDRHGSRHRHGSKRRQKHDRHSKWRTLRQHLVATSGEFLGTLLFLWFSFAGTQTAFATGNGATTASGLTLISLAFGFSLLVTVWAFYRISGGLFNPAV